MTEKKEEIIEIEKKEDLDEKEDQSFLSLPKKPLSSVLDVGFYEDPNTKFTFLKLGKKKV
jgi:hypothetical protein